MVVKEHEHQWIAYDWAQFYFDHQITAVVQFACDFKGCEETILKQAEVKDVER